MEASTRHTFEQLAAEIEVVALSPDPAAVLSQFDRARLLSAVRSTRQQGRPLNVVFVGGFNRGKSSLINGLVGKRVLATSVLPETIAVTRLTYAASSFTDVHYLDGAGDKRIHLASNEISRGALQEAAGSPNVSHMRIELGRPLSILRHFTFIDTPGLGDGLVHFDNIVAEALADADCIVCTVSATEPLSLDELAFMDSVCKAASRPALAIALTMVDRLTNSDEVRAVVANVTARLRSFLPEAPVFPVSETDNAISPPGAGVAKLASYLHRLSTCRDLVHRVQLASTAHHHVAAALNAARDVAQHTSTDVAANGATPYDANFVSCRRSHLTALLTESRLQAMHWMREFARRVDREVFGALSSAELLEVQRRLHFYLIEVFSEAMQTCLAEHWSTLVEAAGVEAIATSRSRKESQDLAASSIAVGLGEWVSTDLVGATGELAGSLSDSVAPSWAYHIRLVASIIQFATGLRRQHAADAVVSREVATLRSRVPEISEFLANQVATLYRRAEQQLLTEFDAAAERASASKQQTEQSNDLYASRGAETGANRQSAATVVVSKLDDLCDRLAREAARTQGDLNFAMRSALNSDNTV